MTHPNPAPETLRDWMFRNSDAERWEVVRLPHDAMIHEAPTADAAGGPDVAYFPGGRYLYRTTWQAPAAHDVRPVLRFEGVQGHASVLVNGIVVGEVRSGYTEFEFDVSSAIEWGAANEILVEVDNSRQPSSRWYPGSGLYRSVTVALRPRTRFSNDGLRLRTRGRLGGNASVEVRVDVTGPDRALASVTVELEEDGIVVAAGEPDSDGVVALEVHHASFWSAEDPHRYDLIGRVAVDGAVVEERRERVGLRTIAVDAQHGLRINGETVLLRGACIHHDNGLLGAATHRAAEFRRIRLLKSAGFNAIRSAHNPISRHLLDACDELGMYVLDELSDVWFVAKTAHDASASFPDTWRQDADRMVEKDRNRPSVIMYASGNEIPESATDRGIALSREITEHLHRLDPDRPVTLAVNLFLNTLVSMNKSPYKDETASGQSMAGSTEANVMINQIGRMMDLVSRLPRADKASQGAFATVDIAGYNYGLGRYKKDVRAYPDRVILGSETLPGDVARAWDLVQSHDAVIGDFIWAGWEYLGEAGVAVWVPGKRAGLSKPFPYRVAGPGMFDLIGHPDITLRLAQAAWGALSAPAIGVRPLDRSGVQMVRSAWRKTDAVESWSWRGSDGKKAEIEVYSDADSIELLLNGRRVARKRVGRSRGYLARFSTPYEPGVLEAVAYRRGVEIGRTTMTSATESLGVKLNTESDHVLADGDDLVFATITIADDDGIVEMLADDVVRVAVTGPGELIGIGSAAPSSIEPFDPDRCTTFRGRALAIVRSSGDVGQIGITVTSERFGTTHHTIDAVNPRGARRPADLIDPATAH